MPSFTETAVLIGASLLQTFGLRVGTEQPHYVVLERDGPVEIRRYDPRVAAQATVDGDEVSARGRGFRMVAGYIFGGNQGRTEIAMTSPVAQGKGQEIAMTSPVSQSPAGGGWTVQFFMPAKYRLADLPVPNDPAVKLVELPAETYAVARFTGLGSPSSVERSTAELTAHLKARGRATRGEPVVWYYDPPWTVPFLRRNEVALRLAD